MIFANSNTHKYNKYFILASTVHLLPTQNHAGRRSPTSRLPCFSAEAQVEEHKDHRHAHKGGKWPANITRDTDRRERRRRRRRDGGDGASPRALHGEGEGQVRAVIKGGEGGEAPQARNR